MKDGDKLVWPGGLDRFHLDIEALQALQKSCDAGPEHVLERLENQHGGWRINDIVSTLRLGLIGGGEDSEKARERVIQSCRDWGLLRHKVIAIGVLQDAILGPEEDPPDMRGAESGEEPGDGEAGNHSPEESSDSPTSSETAP